MKRILSHTISVAFLFLVEAAFAQGNLTPSGAPAPTMKTLDQIDAKLEKRVPISSLPFAITNSGSYYLTTNLAGTNGITVSASSVTIDLMGFTLSGTSMDYSSGIQATAVGCTNLTVRNGTIQNWQAFGITAYYNGNFQDLLLLKNLRGLHSGPASVVVRCIARLNSDSGIFVDLGSTVSESTACINGTGISLGNGSTIRGCTVYDNTLNGIEASPGCAVIDCTAYVNSGNGIRAYNSTVTGCTGTENVLDGIFVYGCTVTDCTTYRNERNGISISSGSLVSRCVAFYNSFDGIKSSSDSRILENNCYNNGLNSSDGAGIHVTGTGNRIDGNNVANNDRGIDVDGANNLIFRNSANGNTNDWDIVANNVFGPILDRRSAVSAAVSGFSAASSLGTTDANANFSY